MAYQSEIEKLEQRFSEKPEQWFAAVADAYRKAGELDKALEILRTWIEKRPNYTSGHIVMGRCLVDKGADGEAVPIFEGVLRIDPENIIALKTLAEIAERSGDQDAAVRWLDRLLEVDPMNEDALETRERLLAPPEVEEAPAAAAEPAAAPSETAASEVSASVSVEAPAAGSEELVFEEPAAAEPVPAEAGQEFEPLEEPAAFEEPVEAGTAEPVSDLEIEHASAEGDEGLLEMADIGLEPTAVAEPEVAGGEVPAPGAGMPEFEIAMEADVPGATDVPMVDAEPLMELEPTAVPEAELEGLEGTVPVEPAPEVSAADVEGFEPPVPMDEGVEEVGVVADDLGLEPFDEGLEWGAGERTSRSVSQEDIQQAMEAHEDGLDVPAHAIPGLESEDIPTVGSEELDTPHTPGLMGIDTVPTPSPAAAAPEAQEVSVALPLIMPDDVSGADVEPTTTAEPEPVVTETMAELYAKQGLVAQAREVYQQLLEQRPGDLHLQERLQALQRVPGAAPSGGPRYSVAVTGGVSARSFFAGLAAARPGDPMPEPVADTPPAPEPPPAEPEAQGAAQPAEAQGDPGQGSGSGFSFDEFFDGGKAAPASEPAADAPQSGGGEEEDDDFRSWLSGLKT